MRSGPIHRSAVKEAIRRGVKANDGRATSENLVEDICEENLAHRHREDGGEGIEVSPVSGEEGEEAKEPEKEAPEQHHERVARSSNWKAEAASRHFVDISARRRQAVRDVDDRGEKEPALRGREAEVHDVRGQRLAVAGTAERLGVGRVCSPS